jgi:hypothetical protein
MGGVSIFNVHVTTKNGEFKNINSHAKGSWILVHTVVNTEL